MSVLSTDIFAAYWSQGEAATNLLVILNIVGALALGLLVGYERTYRGRAAGMRTYGLVCMASAALTVISGYPGFWFGGHQALSAMPDPTRIIQGIVTGIGFLGAGVIMKEGFSISGLTTAASIWVASVIGVMVGVGFYAAAIVLAVICALVMMWLSRIENWLPLRHALAVTLRFRRGFVPQEAVLRRVAGERGYEIAGGTIAIAYSDGCPEWRFVAVSLGGPGSASLAELAAELARFDGIDSFQLSHARN